MPFPEESSCCSWPRGLATGRRCRRRRIPGCRPRISVKELSPRHVRLVAPLRPEHLGREQEFQVALQIRDFPKMLARIANGEKICADEMEPRYLPLPADYEAVDRLGEEPASHDHPDRSVAPRGFLKGTIAQIQQALRTAIRPSHGGGGDLYFRGNRAQRAGSAWPRRCWA